MPDEPGTHLDLRFPDDGTSSDGSDAAARPWIGILFECCNVYQRIYRQPDTPRYIARCPSCGREVKIQVAAHGTSAKFLRAT